MREISDIDRPAELDDEAIPFAAAHTTPARKVARRARKRRRNSMVAVLALIYAVGAVAAGAFGQDTYLFAWLLTGPALLMAARALRRWSSARADHRPDHRPDRPRRDL